MQAVGLTIVVVAGGEHYNGTSFLSRHSTSYAHGRLSPLHVKPVNFGICGRGMHKRVDFIGGTFWTRYSW